MNPDDRTDSTRDPLDEVVAEELDGNRPLPAPDFRVALANELVERDPGWGPRPEHLWSRALALITVGAALLIVGALISAGGI